MLSEHVMAIHSDNTGAARAAVRKRAQHAGEEALSGRGSRNIPASSADMSIADRLKLSPTEDFDPIPIPLLRKYVSYARKYVHPKLSPEAAGLLQQVRQLRCQILSRVAFLTLPPTTVLLDSARSASELGQHTHHHATD